jgi:general secretion pathway protein E
MATENAIELVDALVSVGINKGASDIHLEATDSGMQVKLRIDGILWPERTIESVTLAEQVISRIKVMAQLDISERRKPQDGRLKFSYQIKDQMTDLDVRISIMPSIVGEDAVLRLLDKRHLVDTLGGLTLEGLGFTEETATQLRMLASMPYGMLLVTGPTGSGKTTTLYALLSELAKPEEKTITIEDPVEYRVHGVLQIPVNEKKGLTFATGLRSILRHDPDRLLVGEIRDLETAEIAVQAALTGHKVYTTVHANSALDVVNRFTHMGCDLHALADALNGVVAQRLVRALCAKCAIPDAKPLELSVETTTPSGWLKPVGCADCRDTGYKGRVAFAEILTITDTLREMIVERRPTKQFREHLKSSNYESLFNAGLSVAKRGITSYAEIQRVAIQAA